MIKIFGTMSLEPSNTTKVVTKDSFLRFWWWRY